MSPSETMPAPAEMLGRRQSEEVAQQSAAEAVYAEGAASVEAVANQYEASWINRAAERVQSFGGSVVEFAKTKKAKLGAALAIGVTALGAAAPASAEAGQVKTTEGNTEYTLTATSSVLVGKSESSASAFTKLNVIANHRTVSKARIRKAKREGDCKYFSPKAAVKAQIWTQGYNGSGTSYAPENGSRGTFACDTNNDGILDTRGNCGNKLIVRRSTPIQRKQTLWVDSLNKVDAKVNSKIVAEARTACAITNEVGTVTASAYGRAETSASAKVKLRGLVKAKGSGIAKAETQNMSTVGITLRQEAKADAKVTCQEDMHGVVVEEKPPVKPVCPPDAPFGEYPTCSKNGETTPAPQPDAPGPIPGPSPEEPHPGAWQCYVEGSNVPANATTVNGVTSCPPGTIGKAV